MRGDPQPRGIDFTLNSLRVLLAFSLAACAQPAGKVGEQEGEQGGQNFSEQQYQTAYEAAIEKQLAGLVFEINGVRAGNANVIEVSESLPISGSLTAQSTRISKIQLSEENGVTHEVWGVTPKTWNGIDGETFFLSLADVGVAEDGSTLTEGWLLKRVDGTDLIKPVLTASGEVVVAAEIWSRDGQVQSADIFFDAAGSNQDRGSLVEAFLDLGANPAYGQAAETSTPEPTKEVSTVTPEVTVTRTPTPTATETQEPTPKPDMNEVYKRVCGDEILWRSKDGLNLPTGRRGNSIIDYMGHLVMPVVVCPGSVKIKESNGLGVILNVTAFDKNNGEHNFNVDLGDEKYGGIVEFGSPGPDVLHLSLLKPMDAFNMFSSIIGSKTRQVALYIRVNPEDPNSAQFIDAMSGIAEFPDLTVNLVGDRLEALR